MGAIVWVPFLLIRQPSTAEELVGHWVLVSALNNPLQHNNIQQRLKVTDYGIFMKFVLYFNL
jgi:hypothetical protein